MKLYYCPQTRAFTSLWGMEEAGQPYELVRVDIRAPGHPTEAYKKINPMGKVAGFQDGDGIASAKRRRSCSMSPTSSRRRSLSPPPTDPRRGRFLQWLMFSPSTIEPVMMEKRSGATPNTISAGWGDYDRAMGALEAALKPGPWLFGNDFTAADLFIGSSLAFGLRFGMVDKRPAFTEFAERCMSRPAWKRAEEIEAREAAKK